MGLNKMIASAKAALGTLSGATQKVTQAMRNFAQGYKDPEQLSSSTFEPNLDWLELSKSTDPRIVKRLLPRSCFTKTGPGVEANFRRAWKRLTPEQRAVARSYGWTR